MMKFKNIFLLALVAIILNSCSKNDRALLPVSPVPSYFSQKVLLEVNTGEWCGWCPEGDKIMEDIVNENPERVIAVAIHNGDPMEVKEYNDWQTAETNVNGFPNGSVQRGEATGRGSWQALTNSTLAERAYCGLAICSEMRGGKLDVQVYAGVGGAIDQETKLTVLIVEDDVPQSEPGAQSGYSTVIVDDSYRHHNVLRAVLTNVEGNDIDLKNLKKRYIQYEYKNIKLSDYNILNKENCSIVAFLHTTNEISGLYQGNVLNVQSAKIETVQDWD